MASLLQPRCLTTPPPPPKKRFLSPVTTNAPTNNPGFHLGLLTGCQSPSHTLVFRTGIPHSLLFPRESPSPLLPRLLLARASRVWHPGRTLPLPGSGLCSGLRGLPAALQLSVRCPRVATPSPDWMSRSQDDSPRALPTSVAATVGEDGREAEKGPSPPLLGGWDQLGVHGAGA